jgi:hypothetical protein
MGSENGHFYSDATIAVELVPKLRGVSHAIAGQWRFVERRVRTDLVGDLSRHLRCGRRRGGRGISRSVEEPVDPAD